MSTVIKDEPIARNSSIPLPKNILRRRRGLPSGRAMIGGFLIASAATGTYATISLGNGGKTDYVVASQNLQVGQTITAADLTRSPMALSPQLANGLTFSAPSVLVGTVVVAPLRAGELVQSSDVVQSTGAPGERDISFSLAASRALNGTLVPGDKVDVLATFGSSNAATTQLVVQSSTVIASSSASSGLTTGGNVTVTLGVPTANDALALVQAVNAAQVILVRSTGDSSGSYPSSYPLSAASPPAAPVLPATVSPATVSPAQVSNPKALG